MEKCKVKGCKNHVIPINNRVRVSYLKGVHGYCQIHLIEGLVKEK